jgi:hypothetical protein
MPMRRPRPRSCPPCLTRWSAHHKLPTWRGTTIHCRFFDNYMTLVFSKTSLCFKRNSGASLTYHCRVQHPQHRFTPRFRLLWQEKEAQHQNLMFNLLFNMPPQFFLLTKTCV